MNWYLGGAVFVAGFLCGFFSMVWILLAGHNSAMKAMSKNREAQHET